MRKKTLSTLVLAGIMAATMIPTAVFASGDVTGTGTTNIGYTAGGSIVDPDGRIMVTVPKDVSFKNTSETIDGFDVKAKVWDKNTNTWEDPDFNNRPMNKAVKVTVSSANTWKLLNRDNPNISGEYEYTVEGKKFSPTQPDGVIPGGRASTETEIGTLKDGDSEGNKKYALTGSVKMTKAPQIGQNEGIRTFSDNITYKFSKGQ